MKVQIYEGNAIHPMRDKMAKARTGGERDDICDYRLSRRPLAEGKTCIIYE